MSLFTKRRLKVRQKQEANRKRLDESSKRIEKSMNMMIEVMENITKKYPEYESLTDDERTKIYVKEYKQYCEEHNIKY